MAEKPILTTPEGKKIMTLSAAKAYYESKRNKANKKNKKSKDYTKFKELPKGKMRKGKKPKLPKLPNKPRKIPGGMSGFKRAKPARRK